MVSVVRTPLSLPRAQVQSLVRELKSHKLYGAARKNKTMKLLGKDRGDGVRWLSLRGELASSFARQKC